MSNIKTGDLSYCLGDVVDFKVHGNKVLATEQCDEHYDYLLDSSELGVLIDKLTEMKQVIDNRPIINLNTVENVIRSVISFNLDILSEEKYLLPWSLFSDFKTVYLHLTSENRIIISLGLTSDTKVDFKLGHFVIAKDLFYYTECLDNVKYNPNINKEDASAFSELGMRLDIENLSTFKRLISTLAKDITNDDIHYPPHYVLNDGVIDVRDSIDVEWDVPDIVNELRK